MNRAEVANLLAVIQTYDQRTVGETDVIAWHGTVGDLPFAEARDAVIEHYKLSTERVMPAQVRAIVSTARRSAAGEERREQIEAVHPDRPGQERKPMPDWFWPTVKESQRRARAAREQAEDAGEPVTFGSQIMSALDGMRRPNDGGARW